jgi:hypothetical protein
MMKRVFGGRWSVGTKDGDTVYIERYDRHGDLVISSNMDPDEARNIGQALIDKANSIEPQGES